MDRRVLQPIVFVMLAAATAASLAAQQNAASQRTGKQTEHFTATAVNMNAPAGAATTPVDILVERWSTDAERDKLMNAMIEKGPDKLLDVLQDLPRVGSIRTPDSIGYDLRFARHTTSAGGERVTIMTNRPIGFWEARNQPRTIDYPFTVIEMRIGSNGKGEGKMSVGTKITYDKEDRTVTLENYNIQPVMLNDVHREK